MNQKTIAARKQSKRQKNGADERKPNRYNFGKALAYCLRGDSLDGIELAYQEVAEQQAGESRQYISGIGIPMTRNNVVGTGNLGGYLVPEDVSNIFEGMYPLTCLVRLGAIYMDGLVGNMTLPAVDSVAIPVNEGETDPNTETTPTVTASKIVPQRISATIVASTQLILQAEHSPSIAQHFINELTMAAASLIEANAITMALADAAGTGADVIGLENAIDDLDAGKRRMGYVINPTEKATFKGDGTMDDIPGPMAFDFLGFQDGIVNNLPTCVTTNIAAGRILCGDFSRMAIGQFGPIEVLVNPYTSSTTGQVEITLNCYVGSALISPKSFAQL